MAITYETLNAEEAIKKVRESMAFKGDFAQWLIDEINIGSGATVFWTDLHPLTVSADLKYLLRSDGARTTVRFGDSIKGERAPKGLAPQTYVLSEPTDCALVLVSHRNDSKNWHLKVSVTSNKQGPIVKLEEAGDNQDLLRHRIYIWRFKTIKPAKMVAWYNPFQLARTAVEVLVSSIFGRHADYRLMEAVSTAPAGIHDYTHTWGPGPHQSEEQHSVGKLRSELWLDYVGDVGDGWNATYAVAHYLAQPELLIQNPFENSSCQSKRGDVLVFGGDQVYPVANRIEYRLRLVQPYDTALSRTNPPHPHAYAIPGNHDWYDSLVSFTRLFCQQRWFAGWQTKQTRSYFALKLPGRWWLLGTDVQLDSDIDVPQIEYFKTVAEQMQQGDRVIICTAEPHWVYASLYGKDDANFNENNLAFLEKKVIGQKAKVEAFIAGDQHHYRRYTSPDNTHKITSGGGGAFLHPTHGENPTTLEGGFKLGGSFPDEQKSRSLTKRNFGFVYFNLKFGLLTAALYVLTAWAAKSPVGQYGLFEIGAAISEALQTSIKSPSAVFWIIAMVGGFVLFTDTHRSGTSVSPAHCMG